MTTPQDQWDAIQSQIMDLNALVSKYRADVMNFTGAAANAKSEVATAETRLAAAQATAKMLAETFESRGLKFTEDEWQ
jgi:outer membrane murein-binding lipoprotein Lpp